MKSENQNPIDEVNERLDSIQISTLSRYFGAEITGLNVASGISKSAQALVRKALFDYQILLFRGQFLNEEQQVHFAQIFGPCRKMWQFDHYPCGSEFVHYLSNVDRQDKSVEIHPDINSTYWHSDGTHTAVPSIATVLNVVRVPEKSGKTLFANMYQVYENLDQSSKERLANYEAEHHIDIRRAVRNKRMPWQWWCASNEGTSIRAQLRWWKKILSRRRQQGPCLSSYRTRSSQDWSNKFILR